jgi:peroxiredoxin Q/BCP
MYRTTTLIAVAVLGAALLGTTTRAGADEQAADVKVGDRAPDFTATSDRDKEWKLSDHVGKKIIVLYFYPADMTGGCTKQACGFRDDMKKLADKGVQVVGVSGDSVKNHRVFKKYHRLNFSLLADEDGAIAKKYGVPLRAGGSFKTNDADGNPVILTRGVTATRWTFIIGKDGRIAYKDTKVKAAEDSKKILAEVVKLEK